MPLQNVGGLRHDYNKEYLFLLRIGISAYFLAITHFLQRWLCNRKHTKREGEWHQQKRKAFLQHIMKYKEEKLK